MSWTAPDPETGPRKSNLDLCREQGIAEDAVPDYGTLIQRRYIHRFGYECIIEYYSSGWQQEWYWRYCPLHRYREGIWIDEEWYPPEWDEAEWWVMLATTDVLMEWWKRERLINEEGPTDWLTLLR